MANMARGESYTVRCDRRTRWGNPFRVGVLTREQAVRLHRDWLAGRPLRPDLPLPPTRAEVRGLLGGEVLGCWCHPKPCHCDALAAIADGEDP